MALENEDRVKNALIADKLALDEQVRRSTEWNLLNSYEAIESDSKLASELELQEKARRLALITDAQLESDEIREANRLLAAQLAKDELVFYFY